MKMGERFIGLGLGSAWKDLGKDLYKHIYYEVGCCWVHVLVNLGERNKDQVEGLNSEMMGWVLTIFPYGIIV